MSDEVYQFSYESRPQVSINIGVEKAEVMEDGSIHMIAPSGQLAGVIRRDTRGNFLKLPKETAEDEISIMIDSVSILEMLTSVEVEKV